MATHTKFCGWGALFSVAAFMAFSSVALGENVSRFDAGKLSIDLHHRGPLVPPPSAPTEVHIDARTVTQVSLGWSASVAASGHDIASYDIYLNGAKVASTTDLSIDVAFDPVGPYLQFFSVVAVDDAGNLSSASEEALATPPTVAPSFVIQAKYASTSSNFKEGFTDATGRTYDATAYTHHRLLDEFTEENVPIGHKEDNLSISETYDLRTHSWSSTVSGVVDGSRAQDYYYLNAGTFHSEWKLAGNHAVLEGYYADSVSLPSVGASTFPVSPFTDTGPLVWASNSYGWFPLGKAVRDETYSLSYSSEYTDAMLMAKVRGEYAIAKAAADVEWPDLGWDVLASVDRGTVQSAGPVQFWDGRPWHFAELSGSRNNADNLYMVSAQGSTYRLHSDSPGPVDFRWLEVFHPGHNGPDGPVSDGPDQATLRQETATGGAKGTWTRGYELDPPSVFGAIDIVPLCGTIRLQTSSLHPAPGVPRLYLKDAIFVGEAVPIELPGLDDGTTTAAVVQISGDIKSVEFIQIDPEVAASQGMAAAVARGTTLPVGTDLWGERKQALLSGGIVVVGAAPGVCTLTLKVTTFGVTYDVVKTIPVYPQFELAVDANRDGQIKLSSEDTTDQTSADKLFRFWINDDDDGYALNDEQEVLVSEGATKDYESRGDFGIASKRDLEDFARLWLSVKGITTALKSGDLQIGFKWTDGYTGTPKINLYLHYEADGGTKYLTDSPTAIGQATYPWSATLVSTTNRNVVAPGDIFVLKKEVFGGLTEQQSTTHFLFEGAGEGKGQLQMVILDKNGAPIGEGPGVWLDLKSIKSMYQRVKVTPRDPNGIQAPFLGDNFDANNSGTEPSDDGYPFVAPTDEAKTALVFVHGSNISYETSKSHADTMFKRLWWRGYKGRLVLFYWDTLVGPWDGTVPAHYNLNEYRALKYGWALKNYVETALPADYAHNVIGHSMGNAVVASALRAREAVNGTTIPGMTARNVIFMNAAVSASCFESGAITLPQLASLESPQTTPDTVGQLGYRGMAETGINATLYSVYNIDDYALRWWVTNQRLRKPEDLRYAVVSEPPFYTAIATYPRQYTWTATGGSQLWDWSSLATGPVRIRYVEDITESMAFIARSRTAATGRMNVGGSISDNFNLGAGSTQMTDLFGETREDHSGAFVRKIQQLTPLYTYIFEKAR